MKNQPLGWFLQLFAMIEPAPICRPSTFQSVQVGWHLSTPIMGSLQPHNRPDAQISNLSISRRQFRSRAYQAGAHTKLPCRCRRRPYSGYHNRVTNTKLTHMALTPLFILFKIVLLTKASVWLWLKK
jgi:hypothetical protein